MPNTNNLTTLNTYLSDIGNAIRNKGISGNFTVGDMASNIDNIPSGGGADLSNSIVWDTYNGPYVGNNVTNLAYAFYFRNFNNMHLNVPNNIDSMHYAFSRTEYSDVQFGGYYPDSTDFNSLFASSNISVNTLKSCLDAFHLSGNNLDTSTAFRFANLSSLTGYNYPVGGCWKASPVFSDSVFQNTRNIGYLNLNVLADFGSSARTNVFNNFLLNIFNLRGFKLQIKFENGTGTASPEFAPGSFGAPSLRSADISIESDSGHKTYFYWTFNRCSLLTDLWISSYGGVFNDTSVRLTQIFSTVSSTEHLNVCLDVKGSPTITKAFLNRNSNTYLVLTNRVVYNNITNRVATESAYNVLGWVNSTFTEQETNEQILFNFYNENNSVIYTKQANAVIKYFNRGSNLAIYCTE